MARTICLYDLTSSSELARTICLYNLTSSCELARTICFYDLTSSCELARTICFYDLTSSCELARTICFYDLTSSCELARYSGISLLSINTSSLGADGVRTMNHLGGGGGVVTDRWRNGRLHWRFSRSMYRMIDLQPCPIIDWVVVICTVATT